MRVTLEELIEKLGVPDKLHPYETFPWLHYDEEEGITCSAEVRMGADYEDVEAELQFMYDEFTPPEETEAEPIITHDYDGRHVEEPKKKEEEFPPLTPRTNPEIILRLRAEPIGSGIWSTKMLYIYDRNFENAIHDWEGKGCDLFRSCIQSMQMGELPDIPKLVEKEMSDSSSSGGSRGRVGRKSPKMRVNPATGMKKM